MVDTESAASAGTAGTAQPAVEMRGIYKSFDTTSVLTRRRLRSRQG